MHNRSEKEKIQNQALLLYKINPRYQGGEIKSSKPCGQEKNTCQHTYRSTLVIRPFGCFIGEFVFDTRKTFKVHNGRAKKYNQIKKKVDGDQPQCVFYRFYSLISAPYLATRKTDNTYILRRRRHFIGAQSSWGCLEAVMNKWKF